MHHRHSCTHFPAFHVRFFSDFYFSSLPKDIRVHWEFLSWGVEFTLSRRLGGVNGGLDVALDAVGRRGRLITLHIVPTSDKELRWFRFREYSWRKGARAPFSRFDERLDYKGPQSLTGIATLQKKGGCCGIPNRNPSKHAEIGGPHRNPKP